LKIKFPSWFTLFIFIVTLLITVNTFHLSPRARIIPLIFALPTLALLCSQIIMDLFSDRRKVKELNGHFNQEDNKEEAKPTDQLTGVRKNLKVLPLVFLLFMLMLVLLFGIIPGGVLFIILFNWFLDRSAWGKALIIGLGSGAVGYIVFVIILQISMWQGLVFK